MKKKTAKNEIDHQEFFEENFEDFKSVDNETFQKTKDRLAKFRAAKEGRVNMRVDGKDLQLFKQVAGRKGIPYQTLLNQVIHQYANGTLVDVDEVRKMFPGLKKKAI